MLGHDSEPKQKSPASGTYPPLRLYVCHSLCLDALPYASLLKSSLILKARLEPGLHGRVSTDSQRWVITPRSEVTQHVPSGRLGVHTSHLAHARHSCILNFHIGIWILSHNSPTVHIVTQNTLCSSFKKQQLASGY